MIHEYILNVGSFFILAVYTLGETSKINFGLTKSKILDHTVTTYFFISNSIFRVRPGVAKDFSKSRPKVAYKVA